MQYANEMVTLKISISYRDRLNQKPSEFFCFRATLALQDVYYNDGRVFERHLYRPFLQVLKSIL